MRQRALVGLTVLAGAIAGGSAALAPTASAAITPSASTSSATPLPAGATGDLDLNLAFSPTGGDSPQALTINLPPGYLANAAVDNGGCLVGDPQISDPSPCQVGSGVISATVDGLIPITTDVNFYLVPPPGPGDLAGLAVGPGDGTQVGTTGAITIRPSGDPDGVGVTIALTLPNSQSGQTLSITDIDSTFTGLRFPATCPSAPSAISIGATSYGDPTVKTAALPIAVSGCGSLPYAPKFSATVARDGATASITTTTTQAANESPSASLKLALPLAQLKPVLAALGELCRNPASGTCTPVASVTAASPDYPKPLSGVGYLTGSLSGLQLTLVFPAPFPLTLVGSVDLHTNVTTFTGLPDFPLTSLIVTLPGGTHGLFSANCGDPTGTATATTTDQNGDRTSTASGRFTISGCPSASTGSSGTSGSSGSGSSSPSSAVGRATLSTTKLAGLTTGRPSLRFTVSAGRNAKLRSLSVELPRGLSLVRHRVHGKLGLTGVSVRGGKLRSATVSRGHLVITLRSVASKVTVLVSAKALRESAALKRSLTAKSKQRVKQLKLAVLATRTRGGRATLHVTVENLGH